MNYDHAAADPRICLSFSQKLIEDRSFRYTTYIRVTPRFQPVAQVHDNQLCITGFDYATDYDLALLPGPKAASGLELGAREEMKVSFALKPRYINFSGNGVILPRLEADGLAFEAVNVDKVKIEVRRVGERLLALKEMVKGGSSGQGEYDWVSDSDDAAYPLRAYLVVSVLEPGGRAVNESARLPVSAQTKYLGVKPRDGGMRVGEDEQAQFEIISIDAIGAQTGLDEVEFALIEEDYWFDWY